MIPTGGLLVVVVVTVIFQPSIVAVTFHFLGWVATYCFCLYLVGD